MEQYFFISNNYKTFEIFNEYIQFDNYLNNIIIQEDLHFFKFVKNYKYYITCDPILNENIYPFLEYKDLNNFCFIHLADIEIIYKYTNFNDILNEFKKLLNINLKPCFIISQSLLHQYHNKIELDNLIKEYIKTENCLYINENIIDIHDRNYYKCHISHYKNLNYKNLLFILLKIFYKNIYFSKNIYEKDIQLNSNVVCISSIIKTSENPLLGVEKRSFFNYIDRYNQTLSQINLIKNKIADSTIILLEKSKQLPINLLNNLNNIVNYLILFTDDDLCNYYANELYTNKGLPELYVTNYFCKLIKNLEFKHFFKFAGRVQLSQTYNYKDFINELPVACTVYDNYSKYKKLAYSSSFMLPKQYINSYIEHTNLFLNSQNTIPAEYMITMYLESLPKYIELNKLNVEFYGGTTGIYLYI